MSLDKWSLERELKDLCVKCAGLKPATAKKYAQDFFNKFSDEKGAISYYSEKEYKEQRKEKENLGKALNVLKNQCITSDSSVLKLEDISYVDFQEKVVEITTKNNKVIRYGEGFEYLKYVFKYQNHY